MNKIILLSKSLALLPRLPYYNFIISIASLAEHVEQQIRDN